MIPAAYITEWRATAPWAADAQVEQDLVLSRTLIEIFAEGRLAAALAFRGGTALYKLYLKPAARYSEDIDLVQTEAGPIGPTIDLLRTVLEPWLGPAQSARAGNSFRLTFRLVSEDRPPLSLRLKIEINTREHFSELGLVQVPFTVRNRWFTGDAQVNTFAIEELLGTKLRALYQRRKGRDLFDLWYALARANPDGSLVIRCFERYLREGGDAVSRLDFEANLDRKAGDVDFRKDVVPLLRAGIEWDVEEALQTVRGSLIGLLKE